MSQLKSLSQIMSPVSSLFLFVAFAPSMIFILEPTVKEFALMFIVDMLMIIPMYPLEAWSFQFLYPETRFYYKSIDTEKVCALSVSQKLDLYNSFVNFPKWRAAFFCFASFVKVTPAALIMTFYWKHPGSHWGQAALVIGLTAVNYCFLYGSIFLESHQFLSSALFKLHQELDLSEVFSKAKIKYSSTEFGFHEFLSMFFLALFMVGLQWVILVKNQNAPIQTLALKLGILGVVSVTLICRLWYINRQFLLGGLVTLFRSMENLDYRMPQQTLPLHTSPLLAHFEKTYNHVTHRLKVSEEEIGSMILSESEKGRYQALGEISGLIAHDLSGPLHAANFWAQELRSSPNSETDKDLMLERLLANLEKASNLVVSLRARLKNSSKGPNQASFQEAHDHVLRLLLVQYHERGVSKIRFELDPNLKGLMLQIPSVDLIHVLDNLYRNSIEALLNTNIKTPCLTLSLAPRGGTLVEILIRDNGSGLNSKRFEQLTNLTVKTEDRQVRHGSLGLRLIRRLVEMNQGKLEVLDENTSGSVFSFKCPGFSEINSDI